MTDDEALSAWGYVRLSQKGRDGSLADQREAIRNYVSRNDRLDLATTLNEGEQTSGFNSDREKYSRILDNMESGGVDAVVVRDRARLSRDFDERLRLLTVFRRTGVEWHVIEAGGKIDLQDEQQAAMECVHAAMDHVKKRAEIDRSIEAIEDKIDEGHDLGRPPTGMQFDEDGAYWVADPDEIDACLEAIRLREEKGLPYTEIADRTGLNRETIRRTIVPKAERYREVAREAGLIPQRQ